MDQELSVCEIWKTLSINSRYQVSSLGNIRRIKHIRFYSQLGIKRERKIKEKILSPRKHTNGYSRVSIQRKDYYVHRLVAYEFIGDIKGKEVNHKNSKKNDNRLCNLEIVTRSENVQHSYAEGHGYEGQKKRIQKISGSKSPSAKLDEEIVEKIRSDYKYGINPKQLCVKYKVKRSTLEKIIYNKTWKHIL